MHRYCKPKNYTKAGGGSGSVIFAYLAVILNSSFIIKAGFVIFVLYK